MLAKLCSGDKRGNHSPRPTPALHRDAPPLLLAPQILDHAKEERALNGDLLLLLGMECCEHERALYPTVPARRAGIDEVRGSRSAAERLHAETQTSTERERDRSRARLHPAERRSALHCQLALMRI